VGGTDVSRIRDRKKVSSHRGLPRSPPVAATNPRSAPYRGGHHEAQHLGACRRRHVLAVTLLSRHRMSGRQRGEPTPAFTADVSSTVPSPFSHALRPGGRGRPDRDDQLALQILDAVVQKDFDNRHRAVRWT